jgi:hypothetical protein
MATSREFRISASARNISPGLLHLNRRQNASARGIEVVMLKTVIGVGFGGLALLVGAGFYYLSRSRSRQPVSTSEWVRLMRENDARTAVKKNS